ncbi:hypothetical protein GJ744_005819 [Endocarpon pusillum]|uniref:Uncharacterized protein n=1 Tax=Endocarpon pusillum TaxID=364733 RepID=A0A8H7E0Z7_9EURO|nr:hypothetical protein GJ744_005819 [Endocarpon pusillum]
MKMSMAAQVENSKRDTAEAPVHEEAAPASLPTALVLKPISHTDAGWEASPRSITDNWLWVKVAAYLGGAR